VSGSLAEAHLEEDGASRRRSSPVISMIAWARLGEDWSLTGVDVRGLTGKSGFSKSDGIPEGSSGIAVKGEAALELDSGGTEGAADRVVGMLVQRASCSL
jgi:hypothetical protein